MKDIVITKFGQEWKLILDAGKLDGAWITSEELGRHLGYSDPGAAISKIYNRHVEYFEEKRDTWTVKMVVQASSGLSGEQRRKVRIYSERGSLKIIRHSETPEADKIMDHVFDVFMEAQKNDRSKQEYFEKVLIEKMILPAPREWQKTFPDAFGEAVFKMYGLGEYKPGVSCMAFSKFISCYVYKCAPPGIYEKLLQENPREDGINREFKHHQFLTDDARNWLVRHLGETVSFIRASDYDKETFRRLFAKAHPGTDVAEIERLIDKNSDLAIKQLLFEF